jgi:hypothetical protein
MATTIVTKYGSDAPAASDLVRGELAVDTENGRLYTENAAGAVVEIGLNPEGNVDVTGTVTTTGSVGIGTDSPKTAINASTSTGAILTLESSDTTLTTNGVIGGIDFYSNDSSTNGTGAKVNIRAIGQNSSGTATALTFGTSASGSATAVEAMRIDASGNVGIGVTPLSYAKLHISSAGTTAFYADGTQTSDGDIFDFVVRNGTDSVASIKTIRTGADDAAALTFGTQAAGGSLTERMRIDASGNIKFSATGDGYISGTAPNTYNSGYSQDNDSWATWMNYNGYQDGASRYRDFIVGNGKQGRIATFDGSSGNVLVGTTDEATYNLTSGGGTALWGNGLVSAAKSGAIVGIFNRTSSDGDILQFRKDGTAVGSIGSSNGGERLYMVNDSTGLSFLGDFSKILPCDSAGSPRDAAIDLGQASGGRFKDLHLSGKIAKGTGGELDLRSDGGGFNYKQNLDVATAGCTFTGQSTRGDVAAIRLYQTATGADGGYIRLDTCNAGSTTPTEKARIDASGNLLVGKTAAGAANLGVDIQPSGILVASRSGNISGLFNRTTSDGDIVDFRKDNTTVGSIGVVSGDRLYIATGDGLGLQLDKDNNRIVPCDAAGAYNSNVELGDTGLEFTNLYLSGAISKGSGSFKIDHPLPEKTETHHLVHSFVESPQADNIYRGKVDLVDGSATVNIDDAAGMTEGTYVLLNTNTQCFTSNESGWTLVKGSVSGNTLIITAQDNTCTDTISWMVIGERHDQHMFDTSWTDENGKVIVEPLKELQETE